MTPQRFSTRERARLVLLPSALTVTPARADPPKRSPWLFVPGVTLLLGALALAFAAGWWLYRSAL